MTRPTVATIILNWRREDETLECVRQVLASDYPLQRVYVFDNQANAESRAALAGLPQAVRRLESAENLGFTGGVNAAARVALDEGADYLWLLNCDAEVGPDVLTSLVAAGSADPKRGTVTPLIREDADHFAYACSRMLPGGMDMLDTIDLGEARAWLEAYPEQVVVWATALLVSRRLVAAIGLLDDAFFAYGEDTDFSLRAIAAGFVNHIAFDADVLHPVQAIGTSLPKPHIYHLRTRNSWLTLRKHVARSERLRCAAHTIYRDAKLIERLGGDGPSVDAILSGYWAAMRGRFGRYDPNCRMPAPLARTVCALLPLVRRVLAAV